MLRLFTLFWGLLLLPPTVLGQATSSNPRLVELPWIVIDRGTNQDCSKVAASQSAISDEARSLAMTGQSALDAVMHRHRMFEMISRAEWEPHWKRLGSDQVVRQGPGCAVCSPIGQLLRYDRQAVQELGRAVRADFVWLGVTVVPLTPGTGKDRPDACCREALAQGRGTVLARSSAVLVRVSDGGVVWERDARRLERDLPSRTGKVRISPRKRREFAVSATAHMLGNAFAREHREALRSKDSSFRPVEGGSRTERNG